MCDVVSPYRQCVISLEGYKVEQLLTKEAVLIFKDSGVVTEHARSCKADDSSECGHGGLLEGSRTH